MAAYRFEAKIISRSASRTTINAAAHNTGKSSIRAVAYRMRESLTDDKTGQVHDYSRKFGGNGSEMFLPTDAPDWMRDRQKLWNGVEAAEKRKDAQLARDFVITLPYGISHERHRAAIAEFVGSNFTSKGKIADVGYHAYGEPIPADSPKLANYKATWEKYKTPIYEIGQVPPGAVDRHVVVRRNRAGDIKEYFKYQPHAHVMVPLRSVEADGFARLKDRPPDGTHPMKFWKDDLENLRKGWANVLNGELERAGIPDRVTHMSLADQGSTRVPQPKLGPVAAKMEREGRGSESHAISDIETARLQDQVEKIKSDINAILERRRKLDMTPDELEKTKAADEQKGIDKQIDKQTGRLDEAKGQIDEAEKFFAELEKGKEEAERRKRDRLDSRTEDSSIKRAEDRYFENVIHYNNKRPTESLSDVVTQEGVAAKREHADLTRAAHLEKDLDKKQDLLLQRDILYAEYMALTSERLAGMSRVITGKANGEQSQEDMRARDDWMLKADQWRQDREALQERMFGKEMAKVQDNLIERAVVDGQGIREQDRGAYRGLNMTQESAASRPAEAEPAFQASERQSVDERRASEFELYGKELNDAQREAIDSISRNWEAHQAQKEEGPSNDRAMSRGGMSR